MFTCQVRFFTVGFLGESIDYIRLLTLANIPVYTCFSLVCNTFGHFWGLEVPLVQSKYLILIQYYLLGFISRERRVTINNSNIDRICCHFFHFVPLCVFMSTSLAILVFRLSNNRLNPTRSPTISPPRQHRVCHLSPTTLVNTEPCYAQDFVITKKHVDGSDFWRC